MYTNLIPWSISLVMLLFSIFTYVRNGGNDKITKQKEEDYRLNRIQTDVATINTLLTTVSNTINDIRSEIKEMNRTLGNHDREIGAIKADLKNIHEQIDEIKNKLE